MNILPSQSGSQCFTGTVVLTPTGLIGATTGFLTVGTTQIPIRQVPGPSNRGIPLDQLNGQRAVLCGHFVQDVSGLTFIVSFASPLLLQS